jgi:hypothetical protein
MNSGETPGGTLGSVIGDVLGVLLGEGIWGRDLGYHLEKNTELC